VEKQDLPNAFRRVAATRLNLFRLRRQAGGRHSRNLPAIHGV